MSILNDLTIVIPTFNRNDFLIKLLESIPANMENVIIRDNGGYVDQSIIDCFPKYKFYSNNMTVSMFENWNKCIDDVKTQFFIIPSDDDLFLTDSFLKIDETFKKFPFYDIYVFGHNIIDEDGNLLNEWVPNSQVAYTPPLGFKEFKYGVDARFPSIVFKTDIVRQLGKFDESYTYVAADSMLIQKCLLFGNSIFSSEVISSYRIWRKNLTSSNISSLDWLNKIDKWQDEMFLLISTMFCKEFPDAHMIKDEVYAANLISGLKNLGKASLKRRYHFFKSARFPATASLKSQINVIRYLILG